MSQILIEEMVGYHTTINHENLGSSGAAAHFALAGCLDWNSGTDRKCDLEETRMHIVLDSWMGNWPQAAQEIQKYPHLVPIDLGSMGYSGVEGFYVDSSTVATAYNAQGLALNFYTSYNLTHHDPKHYFDGISSVNVSDVALCNETNFFNSDHMKNYLHWTNDLEGLVQLADGSYAAKCLDDRFWIAPACRADTNTCILSLTAGAGWGMQFFMQWAAAYGIPAALAVMSQWSGFVSTVKHGSSLFYWYEPDASFAQDSPSMVIFPRHSGQAWARGERKTAPKEQYVNKACSRNLQYKAPKVKDFITKMTFDLEEAQQLLSLTVAGQSFYDVSCQWLRDHPERVTEWISVATSCSPGYGIADVTGAFLSSRENATICEKCPRGRFSESFTDEFGVAHRCTLCEPGTNQGKAGETQCDSCLRGTYTQESGQTSCEVCSIGSYQSSEGQTECLLCSDDRTTLLFAAQSLDDCVCKAETIEVNGQCVQCMEGLICPKGSTVQLLLDGESDLRQLDDLPRVDAGYHSTRESPLDIFRCTSYCPGGVPGTCDAHRIGVTCGDCPQWQFVQQEECRPCRPVHSVLWILVCPLIFFVVFFYYLANGPHRAKANAVQCVFACFGLMVVFCEIIAVMQSVAVQWPASFASVLSYFEIFGLSLDSLGLGCLAGSPVRSYVVQSFFFPILVVGSFVMQVLTQLIPLPKRFHRRRWTKARTCNMLRSLMYGFLDGMQLLRLEGTILVRQTHTNGLHSFSHRSLSTRCLVVWHIILLVRGPTLSMPAIVAANVPGLQMTGLLGIMLISVLIQVRFLPWNAPLVNVADVASSSFLLILLTIGIARLEPGGEWATGVLDIACIIMGALILLVWVVVMIAVLLLVCRKAIRRKEDWRIINLGNSSPPGDLVEAIESLVNNIHGWSDGSEKRLEEALDGLCVYDYRHVSAAVMLLKDEFGLGVGRISSNLSEGPVKKPSRILTRAGSNGGVKPIRQSMVLSPETDEVERAESCTSQVTEQQDSASAHSDLLKFFSPTENNSCEGSVQVNPGLAGHVEPTPENHENGPDDELPDEPGYRLRKIVSEAV